VENKLITPKNLRHYHEIRLVGMPNPEQNGVMQISNAYRIAQEMEMDLIIVNDKVDTPICKIVDLKKLEYEKRKKDKAAKAAGKVKVKEFRISTVSDDNDLQTKSKNMLKALEKNGKAKLTIKLQRGRGKYLNPKAPQQVLHKFMDMLNADVDRRWEATIEGNISKKSHAHSAIVKKSTKKKKQ
jgi:translation initiation factor IF-3